MHKSSITAAIVLSLVLCSIAQLSSLGFPVPVPQLPGTVGQGIHGNPAEALRANFATLRGRVVAADTGHPLRRARVTLSPLDSPIESQRTATTNGDGYYEMKDLQPARYRLSAARSGYLSLQYGQKSPMELARPLELAEGQILERIDFRLPRMSSITGRITDEVGEPVQGVNVLAMRQIFSRGQRRLIPTGSATSDDLGEYRILRLRPTEYIVVASTSETWTAVEDGKQEAYGYLPTYFPGVTRPADARRLTLSTGQQASGTDIPLVPGRSPNISGQALDSKGRPMSKVELRDEVRGENFVLYRGSPALTLSSDGTFSARQVPPGQYLLLASTQLNSSSGPEIAFLNLAVETTDLENLSLTGSSGSTIVGKVKSQDGTFSPTQVRISVNDDLTAQGSLAFLRMFGNLAPIPLKDDNTFAVPHVFGMARLVVNLPAGWALKSITRDGRDITDEILDAKVGEDIKDIEVVITNRAASAKGELRRGENGTSLADATILVFPTDSRKWYQDSPNVKAVRTDVKGSWEISGLVPGEYFVIAMSSLENRAWDDPEYLDSIRERARKVMLTDGASTQIELSAADPR
jgi:hypothetical protein